jgi:hypothetical protein
MEWHRIVDRWTRRTEQFKASWGIASRRLEPVEPKSGHPGSDDRKTGVGGSDGIVNRDGVVMSIRISWRP